MSKLKDVDVQSIDGTYEYMLTFEHNRHICITAGEIYSLIEWWNEGMAGIEITDAALDMFFEQHPDAKEVEDDYLAYQKIKAKLALASVLQL